MFYINFQGDLMYSLKPDDKGALVSMAQLALRRAGIYIGKNDGVFGSHMLHAVRLFQRINRLCADGIIGSKTWNRLEKYIRGCFRYTLRRGDTYWILANKYGTSVRSIMLANPDINENFLRTGQVIDIPFGFSVVPTGIEYSSYLVSLVTQGLKRRYPFIETGVCGRSGMGRDIHCLKIGTGKKEVFFSAAHHANEWITTPVLLKFAEEYAFAYSRRGEICGCSAEELYEDISLYIIPLVNPDGVDLVTGAINRGAYFDSAKAIADNFRYIPFPEGWKANIEGTDLNLNYPEGWKKAKDIKASQGYTSPAPKNFVGDYPLSAPESRAIYDFTRSHDFRMIIAYHTQGAVIYGGNENILIFDTLCDVSGYSAEKIPEESSYAGYRDWFTAQYNRPGYTVEAGRGVTPLDLSQFPCIYSDNKKLLAAAMNCVSKTE